MKGLEDRACRSGGTFKRTWQESKWKQQSSDYGRVAKRHICETWNLKYQEEGKYIPKFSREGFFCIKMKFWKETRQCNADLLQEAWLYEVPVSEQWHSLGGRGEPTFTAPSGYHTCSQDGLPSSTLSLLHLSIHMNISILICSPPSPPSLALGNSSIIFIEELWVC